MCSENGFVKKETKNIYVYVYDITTYLFDKKIMKKQGYSAIVIVS